MKIKLLSVLVLLPLLLLSGYGRAQTAATQPAAPATQPAARVKHVVIMSIDGARPDAVLRANMPNVRALMAEGSFSFWARTTEMSVTLPSHTSMLTGVTPDVHKVTWNKDLPEGEIVYAEVPTIFQLAKKVGLSTTMVAGKSKFIALTKDNAVDHLFLPPRTSKEDDLLVGEKAAKFIVDHKPNLTFVHFPMPDSVGHTKGWGSPEQIKAFERSDEAVGKVLAALTEAGLRKETLIILTADHGGAGTNHGPNDPRSRHIPWIAVGPGVRANHDLTLDKGLTINIEDTTATACYFLGIPLPGNFTGKPVTEILEKADK
jgi:predicted AlkP superfamily pyrophosphatase or phosphodiesterase